MYSNLITTTKFIHSHQEVYMYMQLCVVEISSQNLMVSLMSWDVVHTVTKQNCTLTRDSVQPKDYRASL